MTPMKIGVVMRLSRMANRIQPASAFMLLGQRFVIDSYVTGSVVYDKIEHEGRAVLRMLPSTLDVLFALGNDAAAQLLEDELSQYHYSDILAALSAARGAVPTADPADRDEPAEA